MARLAASSVALVLVAGACAGGDDDADGSASVEAEATAATGATAATEADTADETAGDGGDAASAIAVQTPPDSDVDYSTVDYDAEPVGSALRGDRADPAYPEPVIDPTLIRSGGVPPDGIPPIDAPMFTAAGDVDYLTDDEAVILVEVDGDARAYPIQILIWHEIVNDTFGDVPVSITYCPLCNSALAFDRRVGERVLDFGTSGELYQSALVMYDRQTESLWAHFTGGGLVGHYAGVQLDFIPAQTVSWAQFREANPDGLVLNQSTGAQRPYGQNPYPGYDFEQSDPISTFFTGDIDRTLASKARIVGVNDDGGSVAVRLEDLVDQPVIPVTEDGRNLVVFHRPGLASSLDSFQVDGGRDVGQTGVFEAVAPDGTELTFAPGPADDGSFVDDQTGSTWNVLGQATGGPLDGSELAKVPHLDTFWFAWATYRPGTVIVEPPAS
ncbi:MAG: DUF3179 domain-containing protein [Actinomycetota bacterium]